MKALLINGSPRPHGCTYTALTELKRTLEAEGIEVELIHVGNKDIRGCIACRKCHETGKCVFDDIVNEIAPKLAEADAFRPDMDLNRRDALWAIKGLRDDPLPLFAAADAPPFR